MPNRREEPGIQKQQSVTSRCLAIVLKFENGGKSEVDVNEESCFGKDILDDFKLRNKSCYWNPALLESINSLEYLGFVSPCTVLVGGSDLHLENIRTAWGRRVLNDPTNFSVQSIGDVEGINMEVIPQTQFIPLSEILCMVILDLNNKQVVATLDIIQERLNQCYKGMQIPAPPVIYDTLGTLIRERKIFHTGSGYFVVTSDTYRMPEDPTKTIPLSWLHYNPNYIPVLNSNAKGLTRTISCQVTLANEPRKDGSEKSSNPDDKIAEMRQTLERETLDRQPLADKPRLARSLSARRPRERVPTKNEDHRDFRRSHSVRRQDEKEKKVVQEERKSTEDIAVNKKSTSKSKDKGEKKSLLAKIFGRKKKKPETTPKEEPKKVEHATFSDQFPPPEWSWYKEQVEKQHRIHKWMQNVPHHPHNFHHQNYEQVHQIYQHHPHHSDYQTMRFGHGPIRSDAIYGRHVPPQQENHYHVPPRMRMRNNPPPPMNDDYEEIQDVDANSRFRSTLPHHHHHPHEIENLRRMSDGRHTRRKEKSKRMSLDRKVDSNYENVPVSSKYHSPAFPYHTERSPHTHEHNQQITHPQYSSTPRVTGMWHPHHESYYPEFHAEEIVQHQGTVQKTKKKSHRKHGQSSHRHVDERHRLPAKNTSISLSHDSGVNLIGLHAVQYNHPHDIHHRRRVQDDMSIRNNLRNDPYDSYEDIPNYNKHEDRPNYNKQVVCEVEINKSPETRTRPNEYVPMEMDSKTENQKQRNSCNSDSALTFSEQSCETVVKKEDKDIEDITKETSEIVLGDSGFSSPRVCDDNSPEMEKQKIKSKVKELEKGSHSDLCDKNVYQKSDDSSPEIHDSRSSDKENRINMINNLKQAHGDYGVLTHVNPVNGKIPLFPQNTMNQQIPRKFSFEDDYGFL